VGSYVRLYASDDGESHFQDVDDVPVAFAVKQLRFRHVDPDTEAQRRNAPERQFVIHLRGSVDVEASDGEVRRFGPGDVVLVEDTTGAGHTTRALNGEARDTLFVPLA
jgi:quercetin dioxygenase-like cupin family protein